MGHRAALADASMRQITAPNNDTIYSSAQLELSGGPVEVIAPTDTHRYFNITFMGRLHRQLRRTRGRA